MPLHVCRAGSQMEHWRSVPPVMIGSSLFRRLLLIAAITGVADARGPQGNRFPWRMIVLLQRDI